MNCLKALRTEAALLPLDHVHRHRLFDLADELSGAVADLQFDVTVENMVKLNGIWSIAAALLKFVQRTSPTNPTGGAMPVPEEERKAA